MLWERSAQPRFLVWTLVWLGWYANAQLSVVNVLTFTNALMTGFNYGAGMGEEMLSDCLAAADSP